MGLRHPHLLMSGQGRGPTSFGYDDTSVLPKSTLSKSPSHAPSAPSGSHKWPPTPELEDTSETALYPHLTEEKTEEAQGGDASMQACPVAGSVDPV